MEFSVIFVDFGWHLLLAVFFGTMPSYGKIGSVGKYYWMSSSHVLFVKKLFSSNKSRIPSMKTLFVLKLLTLLLICNCHTVLAHPRMNSNNYQKFMQQKIYAASTFARSRRSQECLLKHENNAKFQSVLKAMAIKNPTTNHHVDISEELLPSKSTPPPECQTQPVNTISPDMPLTERAVCGFRFVENFDNKRIPKSITEVECLCNKPRNFPSNSRLLCEPLYYDIPVLKFDEECKMFKEDVERVALACLPVLASQTTINGNVIIGDSAKPDLDV